MDFQQIHKKTLFSQRQNKDDIIKVNEHQLGQKFRSKIDLYNYLTQIHLVQLYLPPIESINKDYLKSIFSNEKKLLLMNEYEELSVKRLYQQCIEDEVLKQYLPEFSTKGKQIDRTFFFNIVNTIYPDYIARIVEHANSLRNNPEKNEEKKDYILISNDWFQKLMDHPYISKKSGKTIHLLKQSTKISKGRKQKDKQELGITLKRFKGMDKGLNDYSHPILIQQFQQEQNDEFEYDQSESQQSPQMLRKFQI